jgi:prefoldin subunit 5
MREESKKILEIIQDFKNKSNNDLVKAMDYIKKDFDLTKENVLNMTKHLDKLESTYSQLLKEHNKRNNINE